MDMRISKLKFRKRLQLVIRIKSSVLAGQVRSILTGLGYLEMMPFTLTNERVMYDMMQRQRSTNALAVMLPISEDHTVVRTCILPLLMEMLQVNKHRELPQKMFSTGDIVQGIKTFQSIAL